MTTTKTAAERFREQVDGLDAHIEIVDVTAPSGFVYQFRKPDRAGMLFGVGELPMNATSRAIELWQKKGSLPTTENGDIPDDDVMKLFNVAIRARDRVLQLSYSPKLVMGEADESKDELSTDTIEERFPQDLAFLYEWVQSGGTKSLTLDTFPSGRGPSSVAGTNRKGRRAAAKRTRGAK